MKANNSTVEITPGMKAWVLAGRFINRLVTISRVFISTGEALVKDNQGNFATVSVSELDIETEIS